MAEAAIKLKSIASVTANTITATNILTFREEFIMNFTPQFMPNTYPGLGMLEKSKWRTITFTLDSDSDVFDTSFSVEAANSAFGTSFIVTFIIADAAGNVETWTYTHGSSYVQRKEFGRTEDGARRNTTEYTIIMFGTKQIT